MIVCVQESRTLSVPYDISGVPHRIWVRALRMTRGDTALAGRLARLLDESVLPIVDDGERTLGTGVTARMLLEKGVQALLEAIENKQLGRLKRIIRRKRVRVNRALFTEKPSTNTKTREEKEPRGIWLGLCGPDQVTWKVDGIRVPNEIVAEQTLREAAAEGISPPNDVHDQGPQVISTGDPDGLDLEAYVKGHLRYCGRLPKGATYLGNMRSQEDVERARQIPGSFAILDENEDWLLFRIPTGSDGPAA